MRVVSGYNSELRLLETQALLIQAAACRDTGSRIECALDAGQHISQQTLRVAGPSE